ncbi:MAG: LysR family transcriptional regulator [Acidaminococcaceae bacterium]
MIGLTQLHYFKALAERQHLTKTANYLMISPPSLSSTISRLEHELGCQLFQREGRNLYLNDFGRIYLKYVNQIFNALDNAKAELNDAASKKDCCLSLAISSPVIWHKSLQAFIKSNPDICLSHTLLNFNDPKEVFTTYSQFDFIMTATSDVLKADWDYEILIPDDRPVLAVSPSHPLANRKSIRLIEAKDENFIAVSKGFSMRKYFEDSCNLAGFSPKIVLECDYALRSVMLAAGYGIVFTTKFGVQNGSLTNAVFIDIDDPPLKRTQAIFTNKSRYLSSAAKTFRDFMIKFYHTPDFGW